MSISSHFSTGYTFAVAVLDSFFFIWGQKKWLLVALDRWWTYTVMIIYQLAWADSGLVVRQVVVIKRWSF